MRGKIINAASEGIVSTHKLKYRIILPVHRGTVRLVLPENETFKCFKAYFAPMLTKEHEFKCMEKARKHVRFSDTK